MNSFVAEEEEELKVLIKSKETKRKRDGNKTRSRWAVHVRDWFETFWIPTYRLISAFIYENASNAHPLLCFDSASIKATFARAVIDGLFFSLSFLLSSSPCLSSCCYFGPCMAPGVIRTRRRCLWRSVTTRIDLHFGAERPSDVPASVQPPSGACCSIFKEKKSKWNERKEDAERREQTGHCFRLSTVRHVPIPDSGLSLRRWPASFSARALTGFFGSYPSYLWGC